MMNTDTESTDTKHLRAVADTSVPPFADNGVGNLMMRGGYAYLEDYVLCTEGDDHTPTEFERHLLEDFMAGLLNDEAMFGPVRSLLDRIQALKGERDGLHLAICGGEDAPGYAASLSHEKIVGVLKDNYASWKRDSELAWDGETANTWKARAKTAESERDAALRECVKWAREAGEAKGKLETSELAGVVDGWRERAEAAEARALALESEKHDLETAVLDAAISDRQDDAGSPLTWREVAERLEKALRPFADAARGLRPDDADTMRPACVQARYFRQAAALLPQQKEVGATSDGSGA